MEGLPKRPPPPEWINKDFVQAALNAEESCGKGVITSFDISYASEEGSGFLSRMFKVVASVAKEGVDEPTEKRMLVKCSAAEGMVKDETDNAQVFKVETAVLCDVMPKIHKALASIEGGVFRLLAPLCPNWGRQPVEFLVMEDLETSGFTMAEAGRPLDYDHCAAVLHAYARFHAASAWLFKERPEYKEKFRRDPLADAEAYVKKVVSVYFQGLANQLKECPRYTKYADKLSQISDIAVERMLAMRRNKEAKLLVLLHGDCWKNNYMFKYNARSVSEVRIIDFQLSTAGSLTADLQHLLCSSASEDVHRHHVDRLLQEYHRTLLKTLRALGLSAEAESYSWQEFLKEMELSAPVGLVYSTFHVIFMSAEAFPEQISNVMNDTETSNTFFVEAYKNPYSLSLMKYLIPLFESQGLL